MSPAAQATTLVYLALGDSYTIGTGASHESRNYPSLLAARVEDATAHAVRLVNPAVNGFTTIDLLANEIGFINELRPDIVSVLIGVNDLVRGRPVDAYRESLVEIYDVIATLHLPHGHVAAISIPDWSVVPSARDYGDPRQIRAKTDAFNTAGQEEAARRAFTWVDIAEASRQGLGADGWVSADDLHPGDPQYAAWAERIWDVVGEAWTRP
jgi:lysophospholipase L1-like esterase